MSFPGGYNPTHHEAPGGTMPPPPHPHQQPYPQGYAHPQPQAYPPPQVVYVQVPQQQGQQYSGSVTKTRPPFPHGKHIKWTIYSCGMWFFIGYPFAYLWHRFGPTKAVSTTRFV